MRLEILKQAMIDGFAETFPGAPLNGAGRAAHRLELGRGQAINLITLWTVVSPRLDQLFARAVRVAAAALGMPPSREGRQRASLKPLR